MLSTIYMCFGCILLLLSWQTDKSVDIWSNGNYLLSASGSGSDSESESELGSESGVGPLQHTLGVLIRLILPAPLLLWCLGAFTFVGALTLFHTYLCMIGRTTAEWMRLPLDHSEILWQHWVFCTAAVTSLLTLPSAMMGHLLASLTSAKFSTVGGSSPSAVTSDTSSTSCDLHSTALMPLASTVPGVIANSPMHIHSDMGSSITCSRSDTVSVSAFVPAAATPTAAINALIHAWSPSSSITLPESKLLPMSLPASLCDDIYQLELMLFNLHTVSEKLKLQQHQKLCAVEQ